MITDNKMLIDELQNCAKMALITPRGGYYPNKNYGCEIRYSQNVSQILAQARLAVSELDGVYVKSVEKKDGIVIFNLSVNDEERQVEAVYDN